MEATIEFIYNDYARIDDSVSFSLIIYNEAGEIVFDEPVGETRIPKEIIEYVGDEDIKVNGIFEALCHADVKLRHYWEE
jgi:hypothetical protein